MMRRAGMLLVCLTLFAPFALPAAEAVFQYMVPIEGGKAGAKSQGAAFLWIPPQAKQVRGVIVSSMTLMEREFSKDAVIRKACRDQQLAILFCKCGVGGADLQKLLDDCARVSGYRELSVAPLMLVGHSAGGPPSKGMAVTLGKRCFGLVQYRGGAPWNGEPVAPGIPTLMMVGQFDEFGGAARNAEGRESWEGACEGMAKYRGENEARVASIVVEPGAGHFAWSDRNAVYLALWLRKAAKARIPAEWPIDAKEPVPLPDVDPKTGWVTNLNLKTAGDPPPAAYGEFKGDKAKANWHFDNELAEATVAYHTGIAGKKDQFIKWKDPYWLDAGARYFFSSIKWIGDGQTYEVHPAYMDTYPPAKPDGGKRWAKAGEPVGHSTAPILVKQASGPVVATGPNTFRVQHDNLAPANEGARVTFMAYSVGDAEYRYTEHVGMLPRGFGGLKNGKDQTITFQPLTNLKPDSGPVELKATSDSGLPVEFYVAYGPAVVEKGLLKLADVPARATYPIEVKVVAYQFGKGTEPQVKGAAPLEQVIKIEKQ